MNSTELKQILKGLITGYCPSPFYIQAPPSAGFPRTEYEFKQLPVEGYPYDKLILTVNLFDKNSSEAIDAAADGLIAALDKSIRYTDGYYYHFIYGKDRQSVPEADKTLRRLMLTFELRIYTRSD